MIIFWVAAVYVGWWGGWGGDLGGSLQRVAGIGYLGGSSRCAGCGIVGWEWGGDIFGWHLFGSSPSIMVDSIKVLVSISGRGLP